MVFYYIPLIFLLFSNIGMFSATAYIIFIHKKQLNVLRSGDNQINNPMEKER